MRSITINLKKDENVVKINQDATYEEVIEELTKKLPKLKTLYKEAKIPLHIVGKHFDNDEMDEIKGLIQNEINVEVNFDSPKDMGIHVIKDTFEEDLSISETKYIKGAIRSGNRIEFEKSVVLIGDLNAGAEIIAGGNIVVTGALRGLAHAGAKGNKKAIIVTKKLEAPQIRIANVVKEFEREENAETKQAYAYIDGENIVIEE
ncbi:MAG: septum site-determining protein MinC [Clostridia bacterium]|nr:septum site-determining protein MinC [Clostridia bacterium]